MPYPKIRKVLIRADRLFGTLANANIYSAMSGAFFLTAFLQDMRDIRAVKIAVYCQFSLAGTLFLIEFAKPATSYTMSRIKAGLSAASFGATIANMMFGNIDSQKTRTLLRVLAGAGLGMGAARYHTPDSLALVLHDSREARILVIHYNKPILSMRQRARHMGKDALVAASAVGTMWLIVHAIDICFFNDGSQPDQNNRWIIAGVMLAADGIFFMVRKVNDTLWLLYQCIKAAILNFGITVEGVLIGANVLFNYPKDLSGDSNYLGWSISLGFISAFFSACRYLDVRRSRFLEMMSSSDETDVELQSEAPAQIAPDTSAEREEQSPAIDKPSNFWNKWCNFRFSKSDGVKQDLQQPLLEGQQEQQDQPRRSRCPTLSNCIVS